MTCTICGKEKTTPYKTTLKEGKKVGVCVDCKEDLQEAFDGKNFPVVWVGEEDLRNSFDDPNDEAINKEMDQFTNKDYRGIASIMADAFWDNDGNSQWYNDMKIEALNLHLEYKEERKLKDMPKKDLPLMIGHIKYPDNEKLLEKLMKGDLSRDKLHLTQPGGDQTITY